MLLFLDALLATPERKWHSWTLNVSIKYNLVCHFLKEDSYWARLGQENIFKHFDKTLDPVSSKLTQLFLLSFRLESWFLGHSEWVSPICGLLMDWWCYNQPTFSDYSAGLQLLSAIMKALVDKTFSSFLAPLFTKFQFDPYIHKLCNVNGSRYKIFIISDFIVFITV